MSTSRFRFSIITLTSLVTFSGCSEYEHKRQETRIENVEFGELIPPDPPFEYYKQKVLRFSYYLIYLNDEKFFELNRDAIVLEVKETRIDRGGGRDFVAQFKESNFSPDFDYNLPYDYYEMNPRNSLIDVEGLVNRENGVFLLRILNFSSKPE